MQGQNSQLDGNAYQTIDCALRLILHIQNSPLQELNSIPQPIARQIVCDILFEWLKELTAIVHKFAIYPSLKPTK
jgi:hypothetical protein